MSIIDNHLTEFNKAIEHFKNDIASLKTGRANPALLDSVIVESYGAKTPLIQVASISVPEARNIIIQPWDRGLLKEVEKGLREANLDLSIANEGDKIRITIPQMTEEMRKEIVKKLNQKAEEARVSLRNIRDTVKEEILEAERNKEFGEDEKYGLLEDLDKRVGEYNEKIKQITEDKEKEIMTV